MIFVLKILMNARVIRVKTMACARTKSTALCAIVRTDSKAISVK